MCMVACKTSMYAYDGYVHCSCSSNISVYKIIIKTMLEIQNQQPQRQQQQSSK